MLILSPNAGYGRVAHCVAMVIDVQLYGFPHGDGGSVA